MSWILYGVLAFRCTRCCAVFVVSDPEERYGGHKHSDLLLANPCRVCSKGGLTPLGHLYFKPYGHEREQGPPRDGAPEPQ